VDVEVVVSLLEQANPKILSRVSIINNFNFIILSQLKFQTNI
jgi:hypothetical protein